MSDLTPGRAGLTSEGDRALEAPPAPPPTGTEQMALCEVLDRLLHKGVVLGGEVRISVADVDLVYLGFQLLLASTETARRFIDGPRESQA